MRGVSPAMWNCWQTESAEPDWLTLPRAQQPPWPDLGKTQEAVEHLHHQPGVVSAQGCHDLLGELGEVAQGQAFLLHGGDCAELFSQVDPQVIRAKLCTLLQMALILTYAGGMPVVKVGRMAGQYAKPRSQPTQTQAGLTLPAYRGDMINGSDFTLASRTPDPQRLVQAYQASVATVRTVTELIDQGLADLTQVNQWNAGFVQSSPVMASYEQMAAQIAQALAFMRACRVQSPQFHQTQVFTSHEALVLEYELGLLRQLPPQFTHGDHWADQDADHKPHLYASSGHLLWVGERTRQLDGAHVAFAGSIANPVGVKIGPSTTTQEIVRLCEMLNPCRVEGKLSLISRMGAQSVATALPPLVLAVQDTGIPVSWICDPMHANTFTTDTGRKTRHFDDVVAEVDAFFQVHRQLGSWPGGISVELTGSDVTECIGGSMTVRKEDLDRRYESACDPRLNHSQALELAFLVAKMMHDR